jgi:hypothetical protein
VSTRLFVFQRTVSRYTAAAGGSVGTYNATSGAPIKQNLVTGLSRPEGIATLGNTVFVSILASGLGSVATYDATSGDPIKPTFITGVRSPYGLAINSGSSGKNKGGMCVMDAGDPINVGTGNLFETQTDFTAV